jgi:hypothetical protein
MSTEINVALSESIQREIVSLIIRENHFASKFITLILSDKDLESLGTKIFNSPLHNEIIKTVKELYLNSGGLLPTQGIFDQEILSKDLDKSFKSKIVKEYDELLSKEFTMSTLHSKALIDIITIAKTTVFTNKLMKGMSSPSKSFLMNLHRECKKLSDSIESINFEETGEVDMSDWKTLISQNADSCTSNIGFNIPEICSELNGGGENGGIARKEVSALIAGTNDGKTIITTSIACDAVRQGHNVMVFGLEGKRLQTPIRFISNLSGVKFKKLTQYRDYVAKNDKASLDKYFTLEEIEKIENAQKLFADKVRFNHAIQTSEIEKIKNAVTSAHKDKRVDLLIIDYGQLIESLKTFKREDLLIAYVFRELEKLSAQINCASLVPMQVNREGLNALEAEFQAGDEYPSYRMGHVAGGYSALKTCGVVLAMSRTKEERKNGKYRIKLLKQREGLVEIEVGIKGEWETSNLTSGVRYYSDMPGLESRVETNSNDPFTSSKKGSSDNLIDIVMSNAILQRFNEIDTSKVDELKNSLIDAHSITKRIEAIKEDRINADINGEDEDKIALMESEISDLEGELFTSTHNSDEFEQNLKDIFSNIKEYESFVLESSTIKTDINALRSEFPKLLDLIQITGLLRELELTHGLN